MYTYCTYIQYVNIHISMTCMCVYSLIIRNIHTYIHIRIQLMYSDIYTFFLKTFWFCDIVQHFWVVSSYCKLNEHSVKYLCIDVHMYAYTDTYMIIYVYMYRWYMWSLHILIFLHRDCVSLHWALLPLNRVGQMQAVGAWASWGML